MYRQRPPAVRHVRFVSPKSAEPSGAVSLRRFAGSIAELVERRFGAVTPHGPCLHFALDRTLSALKYASAVGYNDGRYQIEGSRICKIPVHPEAKCTYDKATARSSEVGTSYR